MRRSPMKAFLWINHIGASVKSVITHMNQFRAGMHINRSLVWTLSVSNGPGGIGICMIYQSGIIKSDPRASSIICCSICLRL